MLCEMASKNKPDDDISQPSSRSASAIAPSSTASAGAGIARIIPDATHGLKFESKLLALFCIRALGAGYIFELAKEREDLGGKFDDVILRYQVADDGPTGQHWRYRYLQAKHKLKDSDKILATHLLEDNDTGDFSLSKYFRSFCKMKTRGEDIHDCIICTNIGFDCDDVKKNGIELVSMNDQPDEILGFGPPEKTARYQLKFTEELQRKTLNEWSDAHRLAKQLKTCAGNQTTADLRTGVFRSYHVALVDERVIDVGTKKFHAHFINDANQHPSDGAKHLRETIENLPKKDNWKNWKFKLSNNFGKIQSSAETVNSLPAKITKAEIDDFFEKLVFVVDMPNEKRFESILESEDVSKYYPKSECYEQMLRLLYEIPNWFSNKTFGEWLTSKEGKTILLAGATKVSLRYQKELENDVGFNEAASQEMAIKLKELLTSNKTIERIVTSTTRYTSVKVVSAIQILEREADARSVSYLVTSSSKLQAAEDAQRWRNTFNLPNEFGHFLIVVCDDGHQPLPDDYYENLFPGEERKKKVIVISRHAAAITHCISDEINYTQLSDPFKQKILSKTVSFQGRNECVGRLVGSKPEEVCDSLEELLRPGQIYIPSFDSSRFEKSLYIKRQVKFACVEHLNAELAKHLSCTEEKLREECRISCQGQIEWFVDDQRRKEIWAKILSIKDEIPGEIPEDNRLIDLDEEGEEQSVTIISGIAGTGKSTLLSHYYSEIKKNKSDYWVIRVNLVEHYEAMRNLDKNRPDLIEFLVNHVRVLDSESWFSLSLLKHRLETGQRIVFMFDGFDEISDQCQRVAMQLINSIKKKNEFSKVYVTARSHMAHNLQMELNQLAYTLGNFSQEDQINYLASFWMKKVQLSAKNGIIKEFAQLLVARVSKVLKDEDRAFIGIPLQCRILAECYLDKVRQIVQENAGNESEHLLALPDNHQFDLVSLYSQLMEEKRKIFRSEKITTCTVNEIVDDSIKNMIDQIEIRLTKLAVESVISEPNVVKTFWPSSESYGSIENADQHEKTLALNSLKFGLTFSIGDGMRAQFLHRTYAEYLVAKYLYEGFILKDELCNRLLEKKSIRKLIVNKILATAQYDGVQVFFDSMLKKLVDDDKEWRSRINDRQLPDRLKKLSKDFFTQFLRSFPPLWATGNIPLTNCCFPNVFYFSLSNAKCNTFKLLCDCLDATFEKKQIQWALSSAFIPAERIFPISFMKERKMLNRLMNYYFDSETDIRFMSYIWHKLSRCMFPLDEYVAGFTDNVWNVDDRKQSFIHLLELLKNERLLESYFQPGNDDSINLLLMYLIRHGEYRDQLETFLKLMSKSKAYIDDSHFFKKVLHHISSDKYLMPGQVGKTLDIIRRLTRHAVLVSMYASLIAQEPEAYRNIYEPCRLEGEEAMSIEADQLLLERDSFGLSYLHRAAFYGDVRLVDQILATLYEMQADPVTYQASIHLLMFEGNTPFNVAAARGQEKICTTILFFMHRIFANLEQSEVMEFNGFIYDTLRNAVHGNNVEMSQLVLNVVQQVLGHVYLIDLLKATSIFDSCHSPEMFSAMAKIVVARNDSVNYKYLDQLVFNADGKPKTALEHIDEEHLQGLMALEGGDSFTKRILHSTPYSFDGLCLLSRHLLEHFTKAQLLDFVTLITTKDEFPGVQKGWSQTLPAKLIVDQQLNNLFTDMYKYHSCNTESIFTPNADGTSTVRCQQNFPQDSFWASYLRTTMTTLRYTRMRHRPEQVDDIYECLNFLLDKLGGHYAKQLLLLQNDQGYVVTFLSQDCVLEMLSCLPDDIQEEIKQEWKEKAPPMSLDWFNRDQSTGVSNRFALANYYSNVVRFYLDYGSDIQLGEFVDTVTCVAFICDQWRSVWSCIFESCDELESCILLISVLKVLGRDVVKELLLHTFVGCPFVMKALLWARNVSGWLEILPREMRVDIEQVIQAQVPQFIEKAFVHHEFYFMKLQDGYYKRLNTLIVLLRYCNDRLLAEQFVKNMTTLQVSTQTDETRSIWAEMLIHQYEEEEDVKKMDEFLECVSQKLGPAAVKELLLYQINGNATIYYPALRGEEKMVDTMLAHIDAKSRKKIQRQVNEFLDETFQIPSDCHITNAMDEAFIKGLSNGIITRLR